MSQVRLLARTSTSRLHLPTAAIITEIVVVDDRYLPGIPVTATSW
jgi:hypothetical protein